MMDTDHAREVLRREVDARLALKEAKARVFLDWSASGTAQAAWQHAALQTRDLQRAWEEANIERILLMAQMRLGVDTQVSPDDE